MDRLRRQLVRAGHRRRAVAVLGVSGILVAGAGWLGSEASTPPETAPTEAIEPTQRWVTDARIALAAVNEQLEILNQAETIWTQEIAARYEGEPVPEAVVQLQDRKALLERQRASLESQLGLVTTIEQTGQELDELDTQIREVNTLLEDTPATQTTDEQLAIEALEAQRDLLEQSRRAREQELAMLEGGLEAAQAAPLPSTIDHSTPVAEDVIELRDRQPEAPNGDDTPLAAGPTPLLGPGRETQPEEPGPEYTTSEPVGPLPEQPDDQQQSSPATPTIPAEDETNSDEQGPVDSIVELVSDDEQTPAAAENDEGSPVETVVDTVEDVVDGQGQPDSTGGGPVDDVVDVVQDLTAGPDREDDRERDRRDEVDSDGPAAVLEPVIEPVVETLDPDTPAETDTDAVAGPRSDDRETDDDEQLALAAATTIALGIVESLPGAEITDPAVAAALEQAAEEAAERAGDEASPGSDERSDPGAGELPDGADNQLAPEDESDPPGSDNGFEPNEGVPDTRDGQLPDVELDISEYPGDLEALDEQLPQLDENEEDSPGPDNESEQPDIHDAEPNDDDPSDQTEDRSDDPEEGSDPPGSDNGFEPNEGVPDTRDGQLPDVELDASEYPGDVEALYERFQELDDNESDDDPSGSDNESEQPDLPADDNDNDSDHTGAEQAEDGSDDDNGFLDDNS